MRDAAKALMFTGAALVLLLPAFNSLNAAHLEDVDPPFTITPPTPPSQLPDTPPPDDDEELEIPPPAGAGGVNCPPPKDVSRYHREISRSPTSQGETVTIDVPRGTIGLGIRVTYAAFKGDLTVALQDPQGEEQFRESASILEFAPPRSDAREEAIPAPERGEWILAWDSDAVFMGGASIDVVLRLACGGALSDG